MTVASTADEGRAPALEPGLLVRLFGALRSLIVGTLFCLTPVTAVIVLGWLNRRMRVTALRSLGSPDADGRVGWLLGPRDSGLVNRLFGGLWLNTKTGLASAVGLLLGTLPFTGLWLVSWWAGWENSFNKGYEQSWVGPVIGLAGVAAALWILMHLPMALAHQAVEGRWLALFEVRRIRRLVRFSGWRYVLLVAATVVAALPISAARGLPVFIEQIVPGFQDMSASDVEAVAGRIALAKAAYVFVSLVVLRRWAAAIYARSAQQAVPLSDSALWRGSAVAALVNGGSDGRHPWLLGRLVRWVLLIGFWFGFVAQVFVSQFLNHSWVYWINHPYLVLPWAV